jgi:hypothetical protein
VTRRWLSANSKFFTPILFILSIPVDSQGAYAVYVMKSGWLSFVERPEEQD